MAKVITAKEVAAMVKEGDKILFGTFLCAGAAQDLIDALVEAGTKNLQIVAISTDWDGKGIGKLFNSGQVKRAQISWNGGNKAAQSQYASKELDIEFNPQGSLMERIRAGGDGLGGFLTPTGIGTVIEEQRETLEVDGKKFILEKPIRGDFAFVKAAKADKVGNLTYSKTSRNSNPVMATAADVVIAEVDEIVETGDIDPEDIITPGLFVDYIVKSKKRTHEERIEMIKRPQ